MDKLFQTLLFLLFFSSVLLANQKVKLQLSWLHQFQFAGYYIAKEKGFYKDVGLDVEINEYQFGLDISKVLDSKETDFAIGRSSLLIDSSNGKGIVALSAIFQQSPLMLLVTRSSGIENIEDLKNKSIMITADAKESASIIAMLNSNGVDLSEITIQKHSFNLNDLVSGKTDAMAAYISNEPIQLSDRNIDYKVFDPHSYGFDFYDDILFTSSDFMKENPQLTKDFYEASMKGWKYAFDNIAQSSEIIYSKYNTQNKTKIQLVKEGEALKKLAYDLKDEEIGCLDEERLEKLIDIYKVLGLITNEVDLDNFIYENNVHKVYNLNFTNKEIILSIIIMILVFILAIYILVKKRFLVTYKDLREKLEESKKEILQQKEIIQNQYNQLDSIINKSDEIIFLKDENLNYLQCNEYFAKLFNKTRDEIVGKNIFYLFDNEVASYIHEMDMKALESEEEIVVKKWLKFPMKDDQLLMRIHFHRFEYEKDKIGLLIFARDITKEDVKKIKK